MRVSVLQENLKQGLLSVGKAVGISNAIPVLKNVLLQTDKGCLKISATNLEIGIASWIGAKVDGEGEITVPAKIFTDLINSLPPERVDLSLDVEHQILNVRCGNFNNNIRGIEADEFPVLMEFVDSPDIVIRGESLKKAINNTTFATAVEESRPVLTGVNFILNGDTLKLVGTDGFRLSVFSVDVEENTLPDPVNLVIPAKGLSDLARIIKGDNNVEIKVLENKVLFKVEDINFISQLLEGSYPDITSIIPNSHDTVTTVQKNELIQSIQVSHVFVKNGTSMVRLSANTETGMLTLKSLTQEIGESESRLQVIIDGGNTEIAVNSRYFLQAIQSFDSDMVNIKTTNRRNPLVLSGDNTDYLHVIMPMHYND